MSGRRADVLLRLALESGAMLPTVGRLLIACLADAEPEPWRCVRCGEELARRERYCCTACLNREADGWRGKRPRGP